MKVEEVVKQLEKFADKTVREGQKRYAINTERSFGIKMPVLRAYAKELGKNHSLALELWKTNIHEARILAAFIAEPKKITEKLMESWVKDFNSWDVCDQTCGEVFRKTEFAQAKAIEWTQREEEYVKRAGFVLMAGLAVHEKKAPDSTFLQFFPYIEKEAYDKRNFVKKAVNWALRQIGKRNLALNKKAIQLCKKLQKQTYPAARWIAADALRELTNEKVLERIPNK